MLQKTNLALVNGWIKVINMSQKDDRIIINVLTRNLPFNPEPWMLEGTNYELTSEKFLELMKDLGLQQEPSSRVATKPKEEKPEVGVSNKSHVKSSPKVTEEVEKFKDEEIEEVGKKLNKWGSGAWVKGGENDVYEGDKLREKFQFIKPETSYTIKKEGDDFIIYAKSKYSGYVPGQKTELGVAHQISSKQFRELMREFGLGKK